MRVTSKSFNLTILGKIVSILEGGYDLSKKTNALALSARAHLLALCGLPYVPKEEENNDEKSNKP